MELKLLDGKTLTVEPGKTGFDIAASISPGLAKKSLAYRLNGKLFDMRRPLNEDGAIEFVTENDRDALDMLRHDASHLMAQALLNLYPGIKFGFGPSIEEGFYYDVDSPQVITDASFETIE
jgi:threonyl-tRNA synthetase